LTINPSGKRKGRPTYGTAKRAPHSLHTLQGNRALAARADDHLPRPAERRGGGRPSGPVVTPMFRVRVRVRVGVRVRVRPSGPVVAPMCVERELPGTCTWHRPRPAGSACGVLVQRQIVLQACPKAAPSCNKPLLGKPWARHAAWASQPPSSRLGAVCIWYAYGMHMVCIWHAYGTNMVCIWYEYGGRPYRPCL